MSESVDVKARRMLTYGHLQVLRVRRRDGLVLARCRGDHDVYELGFAPDLSEWWCSCPSRVQCSHLVALQLVTTPFEPPPRASAAEDERLVRRALRSSTLTEGDVFAALDRLAGRR